MTFRGRHPDELISASLTGDLTDAERAELDAHVARCGTCRETLAAFGVERRILGGLPVVDAPRDLFARVRTGIESRRFAGPWWRRSGPALALVVSGVTVAAAVVAIVVVGKFPLGPVGQQSGSPEPTLSFAPSGSAAETITPSPNQTTPPGLLSLEPGELGYFSLNGGSFETLRLSFVSDATGASIDLGTASGPPVAASLSPDGAWLAYITQKGETGANEVRALSLADGDVVHLGCSLAAPFTDRLAWSPDSLFLAFTVVAVDLGSSAGCQPPSSAVGSVDVWSWEAGQGAPEQLTGTGDAYVASFWPTVSGTPGFPLYISHVANEPWSEFVSLYGVYYDQEPARGVFLPLMSPDGNRAIFWSGAMASSGGAWQFSSGGMPQLSGDFRSAGPASPWIGTPLFTDLTPVGGEAFASGNFTWGPDSDLIAFWDGAWTGAPQSADGIYPSQQDVYVGRVSGRLLSSASLVDRILAPDSARWVDLAFASDGSAVAITVGYPSAGIGDPPSANLEILSLEGAATRTIEEGGGGDPPAWYGPAVYGR